MASLDATKAFDKVNHYRMYAILLRRGLPSVFVNILINWYGKLRVQVRWRDKMSVLFRVKSGVRQGGILSPTLFNIYVDSLIVTLRNKRLGCFVKNAYIGCIMYADDLMLLSASVKELQKMLDCCGSIGAELGIQFNSKKSLCLTVGPNNTLKPVAMMLNGAEMVWVKKLKYLGVILLYGIKFTIDTSEIRRKFFIAVNSILSRCKFASEAVKLDLLEKHCLPILTYCIEVLDLNAIQLKDINAWWNSIYRKIYGYNKWESVKELVFYLGRVEIMPTINIRYLLFLKNISTATNSCMHDLFINVINDCELIKACNVFKVKFTWTASELFATV